MLPIVRNAPARSSRGDDDPAIYNDGMHEVLVYSRKGCHLCDVVKDQLAQLESDHDFQWREVDIDADPELIQKFNDEIPVVFIDGRKAFKYHLDPSRFLRALAGRT
jgi:glutaredoxin